MNVRPVLLAAALAAWGCSAERPGWRAPERLSARFSLPEEDRGRFAPRLVGSRAGGALVVWVQEEPGALLWSVRARVWDGSRWGPVRRVARGEGDLPLDRTPSAVMDDAGGAVVAWARAGEVWTARFLPDVGWERPTLAEGSTEGAAASPSVAAGLAGEVVVVWSRMRPYGGEVRLSRWAPGLGWTSPATLATEFAEVRGPVVATDPQGGVAAVWTLVAEGRDRLRLARAGPEGEWGRAFDVDTVPDPPDRYDEACCWTFGDLRLALPSAETALVAWRGRFRGAVGLDVPSLWSQRLAADGAWTLTRLEAVADRHVEQLSEAWAWGGGEQFVAWREVSRWPVAGATRALERVSARRALPRGAWEDSHGHLERDPARTAEPPDPPALTAAADVAWAAWTEEGEDATRILAARWEPGLGWHQPGDVAPPGRERAAFPALAVAGSRLLVVWLSWDDEAGWMLMASRRDARPG